MLDVMMKSNETQVRVAGISRLRFETDGPGIRTLVLLSGCRLDCAYCINGNLRSFEAGSPCTPEELLEQVKLDDIYFCASGGGITFGGGEPLLRPDFIRQFREICPPGWTIAVETSLNVPRESVEILLEVVDHWIIDIKEMDPERYLEYTGESNDDVLSNLEFLRQNGNAPKALVRFPWIRGLNRRKEIVQSARQLASQGFRTETFDYLVPEEFLKKYSDRNCLTGNLIGIDEEESEFPRKGCFYNRKQIKKIIEILTTPLTGDYVTEDGNWTD